MSRSALGLTSLVILGITAFAATNIDDIFLLMMFFSTLGHSAKHIVTGQYVGFGLLLAVSVVGSLLSLVVPSNVIGLLGLAPIGIGTKKLLEMREPRKGDGISIQELQSKKIETSHLSVSKVAAITFTDGSDNIGVYVPLFASHSMSVEVLTLAAVLLGMTGLWCAMGHYVVNHGFLAKYIRLFGHMVFPFVLIAIGISVLAGTFFPK